MPRNVAREIRELLKAHGPLTAAQITALLPHTVLPDGGTRRVTGREVSGRVKPMQTSGLIAREGDAYRFLRDATEYTPALARERARVRAHAYHQRQRAKAGLTAKPLPPPKARKQVEMGVTYAQARADGLPPRVAMPGKGFQRLDLASPAPAVALPCSDTFIAANADKFQRLGNGEVSRASQFQRITVTA